jgi:hypothetical protein
VNRNGLKKSAGMMQVSLKSYFTIIANHSFILPTGMFRRLQLEITGTLFNESSQEERNKLET